MSEKTKTDKLEKGSLKQGKTEGYKSNIVPQEGLHSVELLHICRVVPLDNIDRCLFPFAKRNHCFVVEAMCETALFEARSIKERDRIVQGLKLTVARLGSMIIVNNEAVFDAFFTQIGSQVPGEAPAWAESQRIETPCAS